MNSATGFQLVLSLFRLVGMAIGFTVTSPLILLLITVVPAGTGDNSSPRCVPSGAAAAEVHRSSRTGLSSRFYFAGACVRSKMTLIAASYAEDLDNCERFAARYRGLALNFLNRDLLFPDARNYSKETCLVYDCPEFDVQISLELDLYDYYTIYARPMPNSNVSCVPRIGVFQLHKEKLNFTDAEEVCESENGTLADVSTGPRSVELGLILSKEHTRTAYIGLASDEGRFLTPQNLLLECLAYRAWAPGHPREGRKCVSLSNRGLWISQDCTKKLPFLCELKPSGPLRPCVNLPTELRRQCRETFIKSYPNSWRWPQCGDPIIDENTFRLPLLRWSNETTGNITTRERNLTTSKPQRRIPN